MKTTITKIIAMSIAGLAFLCSSQSVTGATLAINVDSGAAKEPSTHLGISGVNKSITVTRSTEQDQFSLRCLVTLHLGGTASPHLTPVVDCDYVYSDYELQGPVNMALSGPLATVIIEPFTQSATIQLVATEDFEEEATETVEVGIDSVTLQFPNTGATLPGANYFTIPTGHETINIEDSLNAKVWVSQDPSQIPIVDCGGSADVDVYADPVSDPNWGNAPMTVPIGFYTGTAVYQTDFDVQFVPECDSEGGSISPDPDDPTHRAFLTIWNTSQCQPYLRVGYLHFTTKNCTPPSSCPFFGAKTINMSMLQSPSPKTSCGSGASVIIKGSTAQPEPAIVIDSWQRNCRQLSVAWHWANPPGAPAGNIRVRLEQYDFNYGWSSAGGFNGPFTISPEAHCFRLEIDLLPNCGTIVSPVFCSFGNPCLPVLTVGRSGLAVGVSWTKVAFATGYRLNRAVGNGAFQTVFTGGPNDTTFPDTIQCEQTLCYTITAIGAEGDSDPSSAICVTGPTCPTIYPPLGCCVYIKWTVYPGAVSYTLTRLGSYNRPPIVYSGITAPAFTYMGEEHGEDLVFKVAAVMDGAPNGPEIAYADLPVALEIRHSLGEEFAVDSNPSPASPWSFGYAESLDGSFTAVTLPCVSSADDGTPVPSWQLDWGRSPAFWCNNSGHEITTGGGSVVDQPGDVWFVAGDDGYPENYGVIRYTVPAGEAGIHQVLSRVQSYYVDWTWTGDTDFHVLYNGQEIYGNFLPGGGSAGFARTLNLAANDTIDFVIGRGADGSQYAAVLKIWATLQRVAAPGTPGASTSPNTDFSLDSNPLQGGGWSLGYCESVGSAFTLDSFPYGDSPADDGTLVPSWQLDWGRSPVFYCNTSDHTITAGGGATTFVPGTIFFFPGDDGYPENYGVIRFTVPEGQAGTYTVGAVIESVYLFMGIGDTDFHILKNGVELAGQAVAAGGAGMFGKTLPLAAGDTIEFVVGRGADGSQYASGLKIWAEVTRLP